jgi:hypothetical protein
MLRNGVYKMIRIGNKVRSFDFQRHRDCYIEGIVEGFKEVEGCIRYEIRVERKVWAGEEVAEPLACHVYPPLNGTPRTFGGECNGVELIA